MSWSDERIDKLKEMWAEGMSASQIAKSLGGVTRNAVIGKVHRLGLSNRTSGGKPLAAEEATAEAPPTVEAAPKPAPESQPKSALREPPRKEQPAPQQPASEPSEEALATLAQTEKSTRRLSLLELTERTCKWPIGDPTADDFHFCGLPSAPAKPYCQAHVALAFQPMSSRRDRDRSRARG